MKWEYAVTTVEMRRNTLLPQTLKSLNNAGFTNPKIFVDGSKDILGWEKQFNLEVVVRSNRIKAYGHWILTLAEMYIRNPFAERYAIFQDDFITYKNLKSYLEICKYPDRGYWNLYTFPSNQAICPKEPHGSQKIGWFESNQLGKGAVALIFDNKTVIDLITHQHIVERVKDATRGDRSIDGGVVTALNQIGYKEYVHNPSLTQHTGVKSAIGNKPQRQSLSFISENFNAMNILNM